MTDPRPLSAQEESLARMILAKSPALCDPGFSRTTVGKTFALIDALRAEIDRLRAQLARERDKNILPFRANAPRDPAA